MMFEQLKTIMAEMLASALPEIPQPKPPLNPRYWRKLGETSEKRKYARNSGTKVYHLQERPVKVFTYCERDSKYDGAALREIRARNGVGRPPKHRRLN
jgi:hypothetical protein